MNTALVFYKNTPSIEKYARRIARYLKADIEPDFKRKSFYSAPIFKNKKLRQKYDFIVTIGGDGTLLHSEIYYPGIPKLPLGAGNLQFLIDVDLEKWPEAIKLLEKDKYFIEERFKVSCDKTPDALNEINISKQQLGQMFRGKVYIDNVPIGTIEGDGILISTPTGSTAYALSCGSDIIDPRLKTISIIPVAPFSLQSRPIVLPDTSQIKIETQNPCITIIDGIKTTEYHRNTSFIIQASNIPARLIRFKSQTSFYKKLQLLK